MNITAQVDICKDKFSNFPELEKYIYQISMEFGRELLNQCLASIDLQIMAERDSIRYRSKGLRKTCVKTIMGAVEFERRVYVDNAAVEGQHCVYLLDETIGLNQVGLVSANVCSLVATSICESSYRSTARQITELTGLPISHQAIWKIAQEAGAHQLAMVARHSELAKMHRGLGILDTELLFQESDGIWLPLQGQDRKENGVSKEMKIGIAYAGVIFQYSKNGNCRRILDNKVAYAGFNTIDQFRQNEEGLIASRFNISGIKLRIRNGDGAQWIQKAKAENSICVLDAYHRNKKITECVRDEEFAGLLRSLLHQERYQDILDCLEAQINSVDNEQERRKMQELFRYYSENFEALAPYNKRGIEIPPTRDPENIHHARLGSMESNVFTCIGNRMKGKRRSWSINGANNLAAILCAYHTTGMEHLFAPLPGLPQPEPVLIEVPILGTTANKTPRKDGQGYSYPSSGSLSGSKWLSGFSQYVSFADMNFI